MSHQIAFNGKVHPNKPRKQLENFIKTHKIAVPINQKTISDDTTFDYLVSTSKENEIDTEIYRLAIKKGLPVLNEEWLEQVLLDKKWVEPLPHHYISGGAGSNLTQDPSTQDPSSAAPDAMDTDTSTPASTPVPTVSAPPTSTLASTPAPQASTPAPTAPATPASTPAPTVPTPQASTPAPQASTPAPTAPATPASTPAPTVPTPQASTPAPTVPAPIPDTHRGTNDGLKIEGADDSIASFVRDAKLGADEAVAASNAAQDAYKRRDAITVFDQNGKVITAVAAVQSQQQLLDTHIKNSINLDDDVAQAASQSLSSEFARAVKAWRDADTCVTKAKASEHDPHWNQPVIPDPETKRQEAIDDAKAARDAANQAITKATRLRQKADALAQEAYEIQEAMKTKEGSERDAERERYRDKSVEIPGVLQELKRAEQDAQEADNLALVRANDAGILPQDLPQREQSPWGDILASSENSIQPQKSPGLVKMPNSLVKGGVDGDIVCSLPKGQLVVTVKSRLRNFKAFILSSTYHAERKAFKENGGLALEYEDVRAYDDDTFPELHQLEPVLVATQKAKTSDKNVLVILIAYRRGSDGSFLLYNISRLREIYPAKQLAKYLNGVRRRQGQDPVCHEPKKAEKDDASIREEREWEIRNNIPRL